jgi:endonuclease/exonuclease/phosphatase family metal-dependent hydrolase
MQKLLSLNTEGNRHTDRIFALIDAQTPDIISLYEAPSSYLHLLATRGYFTTFAPMCTHNPVAGDDTIGILVATKLPQTSTTHYYTSHYGAIRPHDKHDAHSKSYPCITTTVTVGDTPTTVASVHLFDTWNGQASDEQDASIETLLLYLKTLPPHILCGDFNMPRGYNTNYERFTALYRDEIPATYTSSLDREIHRAGQRTDLNAPIFDIYMVDYVFSQAPYQVRDTTLHFGVSDHAAVTANISKS